MWGLVGLRPVNTERAEARGNGGVERGWGWAGIRSRGSAPLPLSYTPIQSPRAEGGAGTSRAEVRWGEYGLFGPAGTQPSHCRIQRFRRHAPRAARVLRAPWSDGVGTDRSVARERDPPRVDGWRLNRCIGQSQNLSSSKTSLRVFVPPRAPC